MYCMDSVSVISQMGSDCLSCLISGSKSEIITCVVTVVIAGIIRAIEKRKLKNS